MRETVSDLDSSIVDRGSEALIDHSNIVVGRKGPIHKVVFHAQYSVQSGSGIGTNSAVYDGQPLPVGTRLVKEYQEGEVMGRSVWVDNKETDLCEELRMVHRHGSPNSQAGVPYKFELTGKTRAITT